MKNAVNTIVLILILVSGSLYCEGGSLYSPIGKRDPFRVPGIPKESVREVSSIGVLDQFGLEQIHLRAILSGLGKRRALFEDPKGQSYIITEGQVVGRERATVSRILETEVIITQRTRNHLGEDSLLERVYSLKTDEDVYQSAPTTVEPLRPALNMPDFSKGVQ